MKIQYFFQIYEHVPLLQYRRRGILYNEFNPDNLRTQEVMLASSNRSGCLQKENRLRSIISWEIFRKFILFIISCIYNFLM